MATNILISLVPGVRWCWAMPIPAVVEAVQSAAADGTSFGAPTERELELAELITNAMPSIEMLRMVSSGTEAAMSAIRAARAFTSRSKIIKFNGNYHGHADGLLVKAGSGATTHGVPTSARSPSKLYCGDARC